jgi:hypothetical protein
MGATARSASLVACVSLLPVTKLSHHRFEQGPYTLNRPAVLPLLRVEHSAEGTSIYILGERLVYFLAFAYVPPTDGDEEEAERDYEQAITDILESFVIDLEAQAARPPGS